MNPVIYACCSREFRRLFQMNLVLAAWIAKDGLLMVFLLQGFCEAVGLHASGLVFKSCSKSSKKGSTRLNTPDSKRKWQRNLGRLLVTTDSGNRRTGKLTRTTQPMMERCVARSSFPPDLDNLHLKNR